MENDPENNKLHFTEVVFFLAMIVLVLTLVFQLERAFN